jgi:hypothetical protein
VLYFSSGGVLKSLLEEGHSPDKIFEALSTQQVELVLTAHPTEVNRRTILEKQRRVQKVSSKHFCVFFIMLATLWRVSNKFSDAQIKYFF